ncbi:MAG TPA: hypothetical protein VF503_12205 [Sphingobium sp.]|uniref:hypothetical protein n=1 Tax=Sphingobium sp. TaxID=1912891 RepID=UPI002ED3B78E
MSFLYPRTIAVRRPAAQAGIGAVGYGGHIAAEETPVANGVRASIQARREGTNNPVGLPGDGKTPTHYVYIPLRAAARGLINDLDIVVDDLGQRYQVLVNYWDSLGYRLSVQTLEP